MPVPGTMGELLEPSDGVADSAFPLLSMQQGKMAEAISFLEQALQLDPRHAGARHALVGALLESKRTADALQSARDGLDADVAQPDLAMILARLQLDKGELRTAIETLERTLPYGAERADYHAFLAALLQREEKHKQATEHYLIALQKVPQKYIASFLGITPQSMSRIRKRLSNH